MSAVLKITDIPAEVRDDTTTREVIDGVEMMSPRPGPPHAHAATQLTTELNYCFGGFHAGPRGPGGWWILHEPELRLRGEDPVSPDIAGWRRDRMLRLPKDAAFRTAPDWLCEVLSPSTRAWDRETKLPFYARQRVGHVWLADPLERILEVLALGRRGWENIGTYAGDKVVRAEPFEDIELDLALIWPPE